MLLRQGRKIGKIKKRKWVGRETKPFTLGSSLPFLLRVKKLKHDKAKIVYRGNRSQAKMLKTSELFSIRNRMCIALSFIKLILYTYP